MKMNVNPKTGKIDRFTCFCGKLVNAAETNNIKIFKCLLEKYKTRNCHESYNPVMNSLKIACEKGYIEIVKCIIESGFTREYFQSSNQIYEFDFLVEASRLGHVDIVKYLVKHNFQFFTFQDFDPDFNLDLFSYLNDDLESYDENDAVLEAVDNKHFQVVEFFVDNFFNRLNKVLLFKVAVYNNDFDIVKLIFQHESITLENKKNFLMYSAVRNFINEATLNITINLIQQCISLYCLDLSDRKRLFYCFYNSSEDKNKCDLFNIQYISGYFTLDELLSIKNLPSYVIDLWKKQDESARIIQKQCMKWLYEPKSDGKLPAMIQKDWDNLEKFRLENI